MAKGKTRENKEFVKKTGFFEGEVIAVNPTKEKLSKILGVELEGDEIEYTSEEEVEGKMVARAQVVFWIRDLAEGGSTRSVHFFLKDQDRQNQVTPEELENGTKTKKKQYINSIGMTTWADKPENLPEWFTSRNYRVAKVGEEELYTFVGAWLNKLDRKDADSAILADFRALIQGNVKEFSIEIGGEYAGTVMPLVVIREVEKEGEKKEYEQIYNKDMLPGFVMRQLRTKTVDADFIKKATITERKKRSLLQRFVLGVNDTTYGIKDHYTLGLLQDYDPTKNPKVSGKVLTEEDTEY